MISSELPEIVPVCDRAYVMRDKRIVGELARGELTEENILRLAMHHERSAPSAWHRGGSHRVPGVAIVLVVLFAIFDCIESGIPSPANIANVLCSRRSCCCSRCR